MLTRLLAFLGRHGTLFLAGGLFIGLLLPALAALLRPVLSVFIFCLTTATFLGIDWPAIRAHARHPVLIALILAWTMLGVPVLTTVVARAAGLPPALAQGLVLWAASPPLTAAPAIAMLMGLDAALSLLLMVAGTFLVPLTLPPLVLGLIGLELEIGMVELMRNLALFVGGAWLTAMAIRYVFGSERLRRNRLAISGVNVFILIAFAIAIMDGMRGVIAADPGAVLRDVAWALGASLALQALSFVVFAWLPRLSALTAGLVGGNHNMAIVWANLGGAARPELMLFFAAMQVPIYVLPALLRPLYRRMGARPPNEAA